MPKSLVAAMADRLALAAIFISDKVTVKWVDRVRRAPLSTKKMEYGQSSILHFRRFCPVTSFVPNRFLIRTAVPDHPPQISTHRQHYPQRLRAEKFMRNAVKAWGFYGYSSFREPFSVRLAFVSERIELGSDDNRRRQSAKTMANNGETFGSLFCNSLSR